MADDSSGHFGITPFFARAREGISSGLIARAILV
jgi:hypothetical protein